MIKKLILFLVSFFLLGTVLTQEIDLIYLEALKEFILPLEADARNLLDMVNEAIEFLILEEEGKITLTAEQKQAYIADYLVLKQAIQDYLDSLPDSLVR